jgi:hypothetical protein
LKEPQITSKLITLDRAPYTFYLDITWEDLNIDDFELYNQQMSLSERLYPRAEKLGPIHWSVFLL